jgi:hypothetical protein
MSWRLRLSVETILRLTPAVLGSTVFSIAGLCAAHACLDDQALLAAREAIGSSLQTLGSVYAVLLAFVVFVVWQQFNDTRGFVEKEYALHGPRLSRDRCRSAFKSENGQFVDIKPDSDGNKPSNLIDAYSRPRGQTR